MCIRDRVDIAPDGEATFTYTVTATQGTPVDSAWALTGTITVANPNAFAASATVTDTLTGCTLNGTGSDTATVDVPGSGSTEINYTCTGLSSAVTSNSATVTWTATTDAGALKGNTSADGSGFAYTAVSYTHLDV